VKISAEEAVRLANYFLPFFFDFFAIVVLQRLRRSARRDWLFCADVQTLAHDDLSRKWNLKKSVDISIA
jgi:hypothetical protein